ncbi:MAG: hypothetical protein FVQ77_01000 [Cytophagales bacterium]|nr:hypothetical protein [Cytophagales bacterium]
MKPISLVIKVCIFFFIFQSSIFNLQSYGQSSKGLYPIRNFTPKEYKAQSQNWTIVQDKRGVMYFGNLQGILEYDGVHWRFIKTTHETTVRSLAIDQIGRIYVGAVGEIGYLAPDSLGTLIYQSLLKLIPEKDLDFGDVWNTYATSHGIYFQSPNKIFRWDGKNMKIWHGEDPSNFHVMFYVNNNIYVRQRKIGLVQMTDESLELVNGGEQFAEVAVFTMLPLNSEKILLSTLKKGYYIMSTEKATGQIQSVNISPFYSQMDRFLNETTVYKGSVLNENSFLLGTTSSGVVVIDQAGNLTEYFNKQTGLQDLVIWNQSLDKQKNLWLALSDGISRIEINSPITFFNDKTGLEGTVESIVRHNGILYLATNLGIYYLKDQESKQSPFDPYLPKLIEGIPPLECWDLLSIIDHPSGMEDVLLVTTNQGVLQINKNHQVDQITESNSSALHLHKLDPFRLFIGLSDGLATIYWNNGKWVDEGRIDGIDDEIRSIAEDKNGKLWLGTISSGVFSLEYSVKNNRLSASVMHYDTANGLPGGWVFVQHVFNKVIFATDKGLYQFNDDPDKPHFYPDTSLGKELEDEIQSIHRITQDYFGNIWMAVIKGANTFELGFAKLNQNKNYSWHNKPFLKIDDNVQSIYHEKNGITWLGNSNGLYRYDPNIDYNFKLDYPVLIRKVTLGKDSLLFQGTYFDEIPELKYKDLNYKFVSLDQPEALKPELTYQYNSLTFEFAAPSFVNEEATLYQYKLEGFDQEWSNWSEETKAVYTNLPAEKYTFRVIAKNLYKHLSKEGTYEFKIIPPFYDTWWFSGSQIGIIALLFLMSFLFGKGGKGAKISSMLATVSIVIVFEYFQNYVEDNLEDFFGGVGFLKIMLNVALALSLIPLDHLITKFLLHKKD